jgi:hypothetical protein
VLKLDKAGPSLGRGISSGAYLDAVGLSAPYAANPFTVAVWVYRTALDASSYCLFSFGTTGGAYAGFRLVNDVPAIELGDNLVSGYPQVAHSNTTPIGRWFCVHYIFGTNYIQVANDGSLSGTTAVTRGGLTAFQYCSVGSLSASFGHLWQASGLSIAEVAVYNRVLTRKEIFEQARGRETLKSGIPALHFQFPPLATSVRSIGTDPSIRLANTNAGFAPQVIFRADKRRIWVPTSVAAGGAPTTFTDLKAVSITSSSVQATYDYAF